MSTEIQCPIEGCDFSTGERSEAVAVALLNAHMVSHPAGPAPHVTRGPKLERPKVSSGIALEDWNIFHRRWMVFRDGSGIDDRSAAAQLFQCADDPLGDALLKMDPEITRRPVSEVMEKMKSLAVVPVALGVLRAELLELKQQRDESFHAFAARVRGNCLLYTSPSPRDRSLSRMPSSA